MAELKVETVRQFNGFGNDNIIVDGEYHRSSGFKRSQNGITTGGYCAHLIDFPTLTFAGSTLRSIISTRGKSTTTQSRSSYIMASDANGNIIQSFLGLFSGTSGEYAHRAVIVNHAYAFHLFQDQKGRTLYMQDRYLGMFDGTDTVNNNYIVGTISVTNGSANVVGTGTNFTAGMVGKVLRVISDTQKTFYRINTFTDATHITLTSVYGGTTNATASYIINTQWDDQWKDFGADIQAGYGGTAPLCPIDSYEDTVLFGRNNKITTLNVTTDTITTDALPAFSLPTGYEIQHIVSNSNGILIGANTAGKGVIMLWDNISLRSIAPWIWFDDEISSICKNGSDWLVTTGRAIYQTNGYSTKLLQTDILDGNQNALIVNYPRNTIVIGDYFMFGGSGANGLKRRDVLYRMNLKTLLVEAFPRSNLNQGNTTFTQFCYSSTFFRLYMGVNTGNSETGVDYFAETAAPLCSTYVTNPVGMENENKKVAKAIKVRIRKNTKSTNNIGSFSFKIAAKIMDMKENIYATSEVKQDGSAGAKNVITVDNSGGGFFTPKVGYEVEIPGDGNASANNNNGYSRNVISVSGAGTATEVWTLDSDFPAISLQYQKLTITPFQLIKRKTVTVTNGEIEEIYFNIQNSIKSNKFMIKIDIEDNTSGIPLEIEPIDFIYEDLGVL